MAFVFFIAGVAFSWLVKRAWMWCHGLFGVTPPARTRFRQVVVYWASWFLFSAFVGVFVIGGYGRLTGHWSWASVVVLAYLTTREVLGPIISFLAGVLVYVLRAEIHDFWLKIYRAVCAQLAGLQHRGVAVQNPVPAPGGEASKDSHPWLVTIFAGTTVVLAGVLIVFAFFPDVLSHVESIKVAGFEARFATAATASVRTAVQSQRGQVRTSAILNRWRTFEPASSLVFSPAQDVVNRRSSQDMEGDEVRNSGDQFLKIIARPFAEVAACFSERYNIRDTEFQGSATQAAEDWSDLFLAVARSPSADATDKLHTAVAETFGLMFRLDRDLAERGVECSGSAGPWRRLFPLVRCNPSCQKDRYAASVVEQTVEDLKPYLARMPAYGYAVAFVSDLKLWSSEFKDDDLDFLNGIAPYLNAGRHTLIAQLNFYFTRAQIKFTSRATSHDTNADYRRAISLVDDLLAVIDAEIQDDEKTMASPAAMAPTKSNAIGSPPPSAVLRRVREHYRGVRAIFYNGELYTLIVDWLEGRRLLTDDLETLEGLPTGGLAYDLSNWIDGQSTSELLDRRSKGDLFAAAWISQIADTEDTLGMRELALAALRHDAGKERCARAFGFLTRARELSRQAGRSDLTANYGAHRDLYESACSP